MGDYGRRVIGVAIILGSLALVGFATPAVASGGEDCTGRHVYLDQTGTCVEVRTCVDEEGCPDAARIGIASTNPNHSVGVSIRPTDPSCLVGVSTSQAEECLNLSGQVPNPQDLACIREDGRGCPHDAQVNITGWQEEAPDERTLFLDADEGPCEARVGLTGPEASTDRCLDAIQKVCTAAADDAASTDCSHDLEITFGDTATGTTLWVDVDQGGPEVCLSWNGTDITEALCLPPSGLPTLCQDGTALSGSDEGCKEKTVYARTSEGDEAWVDQTDACEETGLELHEPTSGTRCARDLLPEDVTPRSCAEAVEDCNHTAQVTTLGENYAYVDVQASPEDPRACFGSTEDGQEEDWRIPVTGPDLKHFDDEIVDLGLQLTNDCSFSLNPP